MKNQIRGLLCGVATAAISLAANGAATAQTESPAAAAPALADSYDIVVTARRRSETAQSVPLALTAIGSAQLEQAHAVTVSDIAQLTPNLQINSQLGAPDVAAVYLRGFGIGTNEPNVEPAIAVFVDGIYQSVLTGTLSDLYDVESIEVLRGPQGTLLGKNSPAGAISIKTKRPTGEFGGDFTVDYGRFNSLFARGVLNFPIAPGVLAGKISAEYRSGGGYITNLDAAADKHHLGDANIFAGRVGLLFTPSDNINWYLTGDYRRNRSEQGGIRNVSSDVSGGIFQPVPLQCTLLGLCTPNTRRYTVEYNFTANPKQDTYDAVSDLGIDMGDLKLSSLSGYKFYHGINNADVDSTPLDILTAPDNVTKNSQFSQEFRLNSNGNTALNLDGRIDWVLGAYYFNQKYSLHQPLIILSSPLYQEEAGHNVSYALFAHVIGNITDSWNITVGARETWDRKKHNYVSAGFPLDSRTYENRNFKKFTVEVGSEYKFAPGKLGYVRFAQGYRGGGFDGIPGAPNSGSTYNPETVNAYEVGLKTDWFNRRLRFNLYGFWNDFKNLQRTTAIPSASAGFQLVTRNAASATTKGVELESQFLITNDLRVHANMGYLSAKYHNYIADILGNGMPLDISYFRFPFAPKITANLGAEYTHVLGHLGSVTLASSYDYRSSHSLRITDIPLSEQHGYGLLDASITFVDPTKKYTVSVYGKNILGKHYLTQAEPNGNLDSLVIDGAPMVWGVSLGFKF